MEQWYQAQKIIWVVLVECQVVEFPNGWFRCIITGTTAGSGSTGKTALVLVVLLMVMECW